MELDYGSVHVSPSRVYDSDGRIDAPDFYESSFWKDSDPMSGLGGWGDPNDDYSVHDGGFRNLQLAYPVPHHVRRNFSLLAWEGLSFPLIIDRLKIGNTSFSASVVESPRDPGRGLQRVSNSV